VAYLLLPVRLGKGGFLTPEGMVKRRLIRSISITTCRCEVRGGEVERKEGGIEGGQLQALSSDLGVYEKLPGLEVLPSPGRKKRGIVPAAVWLTESPDPFPLPRKKCASRGPRVMGEDMLSTRCEEKEGGTRVNHLVLVKGREGKKGNLCPFPQRREGGEGRRKWFPMTVGSKVL